MSTFYSLSPCAEQTMWTLTDHSGGCFPNTKLGWGRILNIAAGVPEASVQLPGEPRQIVLSEEPMRWKVSNETLRKVSNETLWLSPVKSLLGDFHSKCL